MKKYIGLLLIILMLVSTMAYALLNSIYYSGIKKVELPERNILDYELNEEEKTLALQRGKTLVTLRCSENCTELKNFLESFARQEKQIILQEVSGEEELSVFSLVGGKNVRNATIDSAYDLLCRYMLQPPVDCALRQV